MNCQKTGGGSPLVAMICILATAWLVGACRSASPVTESSHAWLARPDTTHDARTARAARAIAVPDRGVVREGAELPPDSPTIDPAARVSVPPPVVDPPSATVMVPPPSADPKVQPTPAPPLSATSGSAASALPPLSQTSTASPLPAPVIDDLSRPSIASAPPVDGEASRVALDSSTRSSTYTVQKGDTLAAIARRHYGDAEAWKRIYEANRDSLPSANELTPGMTLRLP